MNLTANKKTLALSGVLLGAIAAVLAYMGNPKNMAMCIACFIRDTAGAMKLHQALLSSTCVRRSSVLSAAHF